jgi:dipeptidyl aminopeptidase
MEVGWVADDALIVKEVDRAARIGSVVLFTNSESVGKVVRKLGKDGEEGDDGWIDHVRHPIHLEGPNGTGTRYHSRSRGCCWVP